MPNYKKGKAKKMSYDSFSKSSKFKSGGKMAKSRGYGKAKKPKKMSY